MGSRGHGPALAGRRRPAERDILAESGVGRQRLRRIDLPATGHRPPATGISPAGTNQARCDRPGWIDGLRRRPARPAAGRAGMRRPTALALRSPPDARRSARRTSQPERNDRGRAQSRRGCGACPRERSRHVDARARPAGWCERGDSNPHALRHWNLNPGRLPIPPLSRAAILTPRCAGGRAAGRTNENARPKPNVSSNWWAVKGEPGRWRTAGSNPATHPHNENARPKPGVSSNWWAVKDSNLGPID